MSRTLVDYGEARNEASEPYLGLFGGSSLAFQLTYFLGQGMNDPISLVEMGWKWPELSGGEVDALPRIRGSSILARFTL